MRIPNKEIENPTNRAQQIVFSAFERVKKLLEAQPDLRNFNPEDAASYHRILGKAPKKKHVTDVRQVFRELGELTKQSAEVHRILNPPKPSRQIMEDF